MPDTKNKIKYILPLICILFIVAACKGASGISEVSDQPFSNGSERSAGKSSETADGKNYILFKRVRILDEMGFDRPVESGSFLVPEGWRVEGGVRWKGINECRADIVSNDLKITSPDGAIELLVLPSQSYVYSTDQMMQQSLVAASRQGGCQIGAPFTASQYLEAIAKQSKASVSNIRPDELTQAKLDRFNAANNSANQQYGLNTDQTSTIVYGNLDWNNGIKGLAHIGVSMMMTQRQDMFSGGKIRFASTSVFHQIVLRYKVERESEALKAFGTIISSSRTNPIWAKAKSDFLTRLGNVEHAGRMERLRLMGQQSEAYAKSANEAADARMRSWERQQDSSDAGQRRFIQTIREVETWKDSSGNPIELSAGYKYGWSRPDGSYILTDNSLFDPAVELNQNWERMRKSPQ